MANSFIEEQFNVYEMKLCLLFGKNHGRSIWKENNDHIFHLMSIVKFSEPAVQII